MKKILLLGNGFTSHLIPEYSNEHMMNKLQNEAPQLLQIANENFEPFRIEGNIRNTQRGFGRCGSNRPKFDKPITGLPYNDKTITHINIELINHGFHKRYDVNKLCKDYFLATGQFGKTLVENT